MATDAETGVRWPPRGMAAASDCRVKGQSPLQPLEDSSPADTCLQPSGLQKRKDVRERTLLSEVLQ